MLSSASLCVALLSSSVTLAASATVETSSGSIIGHPARDSPDVTEYLGVPFAQPPVGQLRFAAPQKLQKTAVYEAKNFVSCLLSLFSQYELTRP